jgi:hypothetical protein
MKDVTRSLFSMTNEADLASTPRILLFSVLDHAIFQYQAIYRYGIYLLNWRRCIAYV